MMIGVFEMMVTMVTVATMSIKIVESDRQTISFEDLSFTEQH